MIVAVIGLGKLGAPMAALLASRGHLVVGVDTNPATVEAVNSGRAPVVEPGLDDLMGAVHATTDYGIVRDCDASVIILPTPSRDDGAFDSVLVEDAYATIVDVRRPDHTIIVSSTVMPGTCDHLQRHHGGPGVVYAPQFIALGSVLHDLSNPDMLLVGAGDVEQGDVAARLLGSCIDNGAPTVRATLVEAEIAKLAVNCYLTTKIAFAQMVTMLCGPYWADPAVVCAAVGTDSRIGPKFLAPGGPPGGPCLPRDGRALIAAARAVGDEAAVSLMRATAHTDLVAVHRLLQRLDGARMVGVLGLAYKPGTPVTDESLGMDIVDYCTSNNIPYAAHDPLAVYAGDSLGRDHPQMTVDAADVVVITIPCPEYRDLNYSGRVVIDPWRLLHDVKERRTDVSETRHAQTCDPALRNGRSPVDHDYEHVGEEYGSLGSGGSYDIYKCRRCGRVSYSPMSD